MDTFQCAQITCCGRISQHERTDQLSVNVTLETFLPLLFHYGNATFKSGKNWDI